MTLVIDAVPNVLQHTSDVLAGRSADNDRFFMRFDGEPVTVQWVDPDGGVMEHSVSVDVYEITYMVHEWVEHFRSRRG